MGRVHTINKTTVIWVYANDHLPPHFHIINPNFEALIVIEDLSIYAGVLNRPAAKTAMKWATANIDVIKMEWNRINPRFPV